MRLIRRYLHYLILLLCLVGMVSLWAFSLVADQEVVIADANLEAVIRETLEQPIKPLHASTLSKITRLDAARRGITSLEGIEALTNLTVLDLQSNHVQDVTPLARLKKLRTLNLRENGITDITQANFASLADTPLRTLDLSYNVVVRESGERVWLTDINALGSIRSLTDLTLSENKIADISALASLRNLKTLNLQFNQVQDISALRSIKDLRNLDLGNNDVSNLGPLEDLSQLRTLGLQENIHVDSLLPIADLTQLRILNLNHISVGDEIRFLGNKHNLEELYIAGGKITDISALKDLRNLTHLGLRENEITDLSPLSGLTGLVELDLQSNALVNSVSPVGNLKNLEKLDIQDVPVGEDVWVFANLRRLRYLDARNCGISDTSALGILMSQGALQDDQKIGVRATVDLRDNPIDVVQADAYRPIRDYWANISARIPFALPESYSLPAPTFSVRGGFYDEPVRLTITTDVADASIYYTLDGSEPTGESTLYDGPIQVNSRMDEANRLSKIKGTSTRWKVPVDKVAKATVVRARLIREDQTVSPIVTNTYFVAMGNKYTFPVISIATNSDSFFDYQHGIYVMGEIYDQYAAMYNFLNPWERPANYKQSGEGWERPAHIEYFDPSGVQAFSQNVQVRIHGGATRELPQKSLRVYASCESGCEGTVDYPMFPGLIGQGTGTPITSFTTFLLRNSGNDWGSTMFRDAFVQSLMDQTRLDTQAYQPAIVFLNGEYWGIHNLRERLDEYYVQNHYGIDPLDVVILTENAALEVGVEGDQEHYQRMIEFIKTHDMRAAENYAQVQTWMDIDNFIDYQILEIYSNNNNWPHVNIKYWRKRTSSYQPDAPYGQDGRWRWMVYDTDFAFGLNEGLEGSSGNNLVAAIQPNWHDWAGTLLRGLLDNPEFRERFLSRFADLMNTAFEPQRVVARIDQMKAVVEPEIVEHAARWRGTKTGLDAWNQQVDIMRVFARERPEHMYQQLVEYFQLSGTVQVHLETDEEAGYIRINSVDITAATAGVASPQSWTGTYFQGMPIQITAVARPGYRFERWEAANAPAGSTEQIQITPEKDITLRAIFARE